MPELIEMMIGQVAGGLVDNIASNLTKSSWFQEFIDPTAYFAKQNEKYEEGQISKDETTLQMNALANQKAQLFGAGTNRYNVIEDNAYARKDAVINKSLKKAKGILNYDKEEANASSSWLSWL